MMDMEKILQKTWEILSKIKPNFAINLLVRTPVEIEQHLAWNIFFLGEIIEKGKVIHESAMNGLLTYSPA
jgi:uncharacterized protein